MPAEGHRKRTLLAKVRPQGRKSTVCPTSRGLVMIAFDKFLEANPDMSERPYGDAMAASLSRAFPCQTSAALAQKSAAYYLRVSSVGRKFRCSGRSLVSAPPR